MKLYTIWKTDNKYRKLHAPWGNEDTKTLIELLEKHDVKVTFFMTGEWVDNFPEDVKLIVSKGHDLGNHSQSLLNMSQLSKKQIKEELELVHNKVKELTGIEMDLFRPPFGDYNNDVILTAKDCDYYTIQWDVDTLVTKCKGV